MGPVGGQANYYIPDLKTTLLFGIPAEVWQNSKIANELLFRFLKKIWSKEEVPPELVVGIWYLCHDIQKRES